MITTKDMLEILRAKCKNFDLVEDYTESGLDVDAPGINYKSLRLQIPTKAWKHQYIDIDYQRCYGSYTNKVFVSTNISNDFRNTKYTKLNSSFVKRIEKILDRYKEELDDEMKTEKEMKQKSFDLQAKIDEVNEMYSNCIEVYSESDLSEPFPILVIGSRKYNINLEDEVVSLDCFTTYPAFTNPEVGRESSYPLHLAIPFLQDVELFKLL